MRKSENQQWTVSEITLVKNDEWEGTNNGNSDLVISTQNCSRDVGKIVHSTLFDYLTFHKCNAKSMAILWNIEFYSCLTQHFDKILRHSLLILISK